MSYHRAITKIRGDVVGSVRCHQNKAGVIANFQVLVITPWGNGPAHTEEYRCVAFGKLGTEIQHSIREGQIVTVSGFMRSSEWSDGSGKQNHQLITDTFKIESGPAVKAPPVQKPVEQAPAPIDKTKQRTHGRNARKPKQPVTDFRAVAGEPEFNDPVPF